MPYILPEDRKQYDESLNALLDKLGSQTESDFAGHFNYCVSRLLCQLFNNNPRYVRINTLIGAVEGAKHEFYRRVVVPYEEKKIQENGDVF